MPIHDNKDIAKLVLIFWQPKIWVVAMETSHLLYTGPNLFDHNNWFQKVHIFLLQVKCLVDGSNSSLRVEVVCVSRGRDHYNDDSLSMYRHVPTLFVLFPNAWFNVVLSQVVFSTYRVRSPEHYIGETCDLHLDKTILLIHLTVSKTLIKIGWRVDWSFLTVFCLFNVPWFPQKVYCILKV